MIQVDPRASADRLGSATAALNADIRSLDDSKWGEPSSCQGWLISDLVAHVVRNGWSMLNYIPRSLANDPTPTFGPSVMHIQDEIKAAGPQAAAERQEHETAELIQTVKGLSDADLAVIGHGHPIGPWPNSWVPSQRLVEVVYHHWDLQHSTGCNGPLDNELASYLLAFMLKAGQRLPVAVPPAKEGAPQQTFKLTTTNDHASWLLQTGPGGLQVVAEGDGPADVGLAADSGWLALAIYGRASVASDSFTLSGGSDALERFRAVFGG